MRRNLKSGASGLLVLTSSLAAASSKWFLVWLAQQYGGPAMLGSYGLFFAVATPVFVVSQLGLRTIFVSKSVALPWSSYVRLRMLGLAFGTLVIGLFIAFSESVSVQLGMAVLLLKLADSMVDLELAKVQYAGRLNTVSYVLLAGALLSFALSALGVIVAGSFILGVFGAAASGFVTFLVSKFHSARVRYVHDVRHSGIREIVQASVPVAGAQLLASLLLYLPTLFLGFGADLRSAGVYVGLAYVLTVADLLGASISKFLVTPLRNRRASYGDRAVVATVVKMTALLSGMGLLPLFLMVLFGSDLFAAIYGPDFRVSADVLLLFGAAAYFIMLSHSQSIGLNVLNRYYSVVWSFAFACVISVAAGFGMHLIGVSPLLIGSGMAAAGAAARLGILMWSNYRAVR